MPLNFLQITDMHKNDFFKIIGYDSYTNAGIKTHSGKETRPWNWRNSTYIVMKSKESHLRKSEGSHQETQCEIRKPDPSFPVSCHSQQGHEIRVSRRKSAWGRRLIPTYLSGPAAQRSSGHFIYILTGAVNFIDLRICPLTLIHSAVPILRGVIYFCHRVLLPANSLADNNIYFKGLVKSVKNTQVILLKREKMC